MAQVHARDTIIVGCDTIILQKLGLRTQDEPGHFGPAASSDSIFKSVDVQARFPGGDSSFLEFVKDHFNYPARCQEEGISGYVQLRFVVDKKGSISNIVELEVTKSCPEFTDECIWLLRKSPKWIPAQVNGKIVSSYRIIPIKLNIE